MRSGTIGLVLISALALAACNRPTSAPGGPHGRYLGVGIYSAGEAWRRMTAQAPAPRPAAARIADDEHVIVVVDSDTGEIRQCGDQSGYCTGMNPWAKALLATQQAPVDLAKPAAAPTAP